VSRYYMAVAHLAFSVVDLKKIRIFSENIKYKLCIKLVQLFSNLSYGHN